MAAEFLLALKDPDWARRNWPRLLRTIRELPSFRSNPADELWLKGADGEGSWAYDVRFFEQGDDTLLLEISARPPSIEADLRRVLSWLRAETTISVEDEDGEASGW